MKTFTVTKEFTIVHTFKYEVEAEDADQALDIAVEGGLDPFFEGDEVVFSDYTVNEF